MRSVHAAHRAFRIFPSFSEPGTSPVSSSMYAYRPRQGDLLKVSETGDQAFVVVPALDVSISQQISDVDNIPLHGVLLEVLRTDDQTFVVVPTLHVSTNTKVHHKNIPRQNDFLEVVETGDQTVVVVPTLDVNVSMRI